MSKYKEAQWNVIGGLANGSTREKVIFTGVNVLWFDTELRPIFEAVLESPQGWTAKYPPDSHEFDKVCSYLRNIANVDYWIVQLSDEFRKVEIARLFRVGAEIVASGGDPTEIVDQINETKDVNVMVDEDSDYYQDFLRLCQEKKIRINTPIQMINDHAPINIGDYVVVCARPGTGKTSLVSQIMVSAARQGHRVLYFSLDDPYKLALGKFASQISTAPSRWLQNNPESDHTVKAFEEFESLNIKIAPGNLTDLEDICNYVAKYKAAHPDLTLVVCDHIGKISAPGKNLYESTTNASKELFLLTKKHDLAVITLAQLNRSVETEKRPVRMSDLRDSGKIEEDATMIYGMYLKATKEDCPDTTWSESNPPVPEGWAVQFDVLKNKDGYTCSMPLYFTGPIFTFTEHKK